MPLNVLVACEYSGRVRRAFRAIGHNAWGCDLLPAEDESEFHYQIDAGLVTGMFHWDLVIAHPPCTRLCNSGNRWRKDRQQETTEAIAFFLMFTRLTCAWAIENPIGIMSSVYRKPDQIIQPWQFGHGETKATCLWLNGLPLLKPTNIVDGRVPRIHHMAPGPNSWKERSRTYEGIAEAMASQWSAALTSVASAP